MRISIERRRQLPATELIEIVTPRTNAATITPMENLFAAVSLPEPFALEFTATYESRRFLVRTRSVAMRRHLTEQLGVAYPQAVIRMHTDGRGSNPDPARLRPDEQVAACSLVLRSPDYLPLRTFGDTDVDGDRSAQADPVLGILGAAGNMPEGWRTLCQLVLCPAPDGWSRRYLRLYLEHESRAQRPVEHSDTSLTSVFLLASLIVAGAVGYQGYQWYTVADWLEFGLLAGSVGAGVPGVYRLWRRMSNRPVVDPRLIREKLDARIAYLTQFRLAVFAPAAATHSEIEGRLRQLAAAYRQFSLAAGNGLEPQPLRVGHRDLRELVRLPGERAGSILSTRELAGIWHLPQAQADLPLVERTTERRFLPRPETVARGCTIGVSERQGRRVEVRVPDSVLGRNSLLVAKTRRGKSSLMLLLARHMIARPDAQGRRRCLVLVDPHSDLARDALSLVTPERRDSVVYLDVGNAERPFGLNLLDTVLWPDRDRAVSSTLTIFNREFDRSWGSRMEDAFRFALLTLYEVNEALCKGNPGGRAQQYTVLDVPSLYDNGPFRDSVLEATSDHRIRDWWHRYERKDRRLQEEITTPVKTKIHRFAGSRAGQALLGQPASTTDPAGWVREGSVVIVNTARGIVGEGTSSLVGATLINLVAMVAAQQAEKEAGERRPVTFLVDEFQSMPGADYEYILGELAKYGVNLVLATQSLASLEATDRENNRRLRQKVFSNIDGLFAFHVSTEDARYLVPELGGALEEADLGELGNYRCYARLTVDGERLPPFSVQLLPPLKGDPSVREELAARSARDHGRERRLVDADLRQALARIELAERRAVERTGGQWAHSGAGVGTIVPDFQPGDLQKRKQARTRNRPPSDEQTRQPQLPLADLSENSDARREAVDTGREVSGESDDTAKGGL